MVLWAFVLSLGLVLLLRRLNLVLPDVKLEELVILDAFDGRLAEEFLVLEWLLWVLSLPEFLVLCNLWFLLVVGLELYDFWLLLVVGLELLDPPQKQV